jgi:hypothetical protein
MASLEQRIEAERVRGDRAGSGLDAESRTRRELETMRVQLAARQELIRAAEAITEDTPGAHSAAGHGSSERGELGEVAVGASAA